MTGPPKRTPESVALAVFRIELVSRGDMPDRSLPRHYRNGQDEPMPGVELDHCRPPHQLVRHWWPIIG
jgi:hypothetical protein